MNLENISEKTGIVFAKLAEEKFLNEYTLVGGTALSLQIGHRLSEDLDFIYFGNILNSLNIKKFIEKKFKGSYKLVKQDNDHQIDFLIDDVRVTFFTTDSVLISFDVKDFSVKYNQVYIAATDIIAVMKINALSHRNTIRDYYDLYFIAKYFISLEKIYELCKKHLPNISEITYSETITYVDDIKEDSIANYLKPKENLTKIEISDYFTKEIKNLFYKKIN